MKPDFIPEGEEGWVWEKGALHALFALKGLQVGDEIFYAGRSPYNAIRPEAPRRAPITEMHQTEMICTFYANPEVQTEGWKILAWRRPNAQHS
jgi:hypothetical protein